MPQKAKDGELSVVSKCLTQGLTRAQLLKAAGIAAAAAAVPGVASAQTGGPDTVQGTAAGTGTFSFPYYPQVTGTYSPETIPSILNIAQTMEYLATTVVNAGVTNASKLGINPLMLGALQAALAEEVYHVQFLASMGATPMTTTFTLPDPAALTNATVFFRMLELLESVCTAAYITANREFAELGQPLLAKFAMQAGVVEGEHRVAARTALALLNPSAAPAPAAGAGTGTGTGTGVGTGAPWTGAAGVAAPPVSSPIPPNNKAFATDYFVHLADAAALIQSLGLIGGTGTALAFPGTATALSNAGAAGAAVQQQLPNNATASATAATVVSALNAMGVTTGVVARGGSGSGTP